MAKKRRNQKNPINAQQLQSDITPWQRAQVQDMLNTLNEPNEVHNLIIAALFIGKSKELENLSTHDKNIFECLQSIPEEEILNLYTQLSHYGQLESLQFLATYLKKQYKLEGNVISEAIIGTYANTQTKEKIVSFLTSQGANPNEVTADGYTAAHFAAAEGYVGILKILLCNKAHFNIRSHDGLSPLDLAISHKELGAIRFLEDPNQGGLQFSPITIQEKTYITKAEFSEFKIKIVSSNKANTPHIKMMFYYNTFHAAMWARTHNSDSKTWLLRQEEEIIKSISSSDDIGMLKYIYMSTSKDINEAENKVNKLIQAIRRSKLDADTKDREVATIQASLGLAFLDFDTIKAIKYCNECLETCKHRNQDVIIDAHILLTIAYESINPEKAQKAIKFLNSVSSSTPSLKTTFYLGIIFSFYIKIGNRKQAIAVIKKVSDDSLLNFYSEAIHRSAFTPYFPQVKELILQQIGQNELAVQVRKLLHTIDSITAETFIDNAIQKFNDNPYKQIFINILIACIDANRINEGLDFFESKMGDVGFGETLPIRLLHAKLLILSGRVKYKEAIAIVQKLEVITEYGPGANALISSLYSHAILLLESTEERVAVKDEVLQRALELDNNNEVIKLTIELKKSHQKAQEEHEGQLAQNYASENKEAIQGQNDISTIDDEVPNDVRAELVGYLQELNIKDTGTIEEAIKNPALWERLKHMQYTRTKHQVHKLFGIHTNTIEYSWYINGASYEYRDDSKIHLVENRHNTFATIDEKVFIQLDPAIQASCTAALSKATYKGSRANGVKQLDSVIELRIPWDTRLWTNTIYTNPHGCRLIIFNREGTHATIKRENRPNAKVIRETVPPVDASQSLLEQKHSQEERKDKEPGVVKLQNTHNLKALVRTSSLKLEDGAPLQLPLATHENEAETLTQQALANNQQIIITDHISLPSINLQTIRDLPKADRNIFYQFIELSAASLKKVDNYVNRLVMPLLQINSRLECPQLVAHYLKNNQALSHAFKKLPLATNLNKIGKQAKIHRYTFKSQPNTEYNPQPYLGWMDSLGITKWGIKGANVAMDWAVTYNHYSTEHLIKATVSSVSCAISLFGYYTGNPIVILAGNTPNILLSLYKHEWETASYEVLNTAALSVLPPIIYGAMPAIAFTLDLSYTGYSAISTVGRAYDLYTESQQEQEAIGGIEKTSFSKEY